MRDSMRRARGMTASLSSPRQCVMRIVGVVEIRRMACVGQPLPPDARMEIRMSS